MIFNAVVIHSPVLEKPLVDRLWVGVGEVSRR
jgi:hypothetical protein